MKKINSESNHSQEISEKSQTEKKKCISRIDIHLVFEKLFSRSRIYLRGLRGLNGRYSRISHLTVLLLSYFFNKCGLRLTEHFIFWVPQLERYHDIFFFWLWHTLLYSKYFELVLALKSHDILMHVVGLFILYFQHVPFLHLEFPLRLINKAMVFFSY